MKKRTLTHSAPSAFNFVLTMGVVNLFADMTYEGAGSINGQFMGMTVARKYFPQPARRKRPV